MGVAENYRKIRREVPEGVAIVVAAKTRTPEEVAEVIGAGAVHIGENYVQEAERMHAALGDEAKRARWYMIGDLQTNKINKALKVLDAVQTVATFEQAEAIDKRVVAAGRDSVEILIEVNAGSEDSKTGAPPDEARLADLVRRIAGLEHLKLEGLMTMGPLTGDPEDARPYFRQVKALYDRIRSLNIPGVKLSVLSMGMSDSYPVAIEEGATMVRIGTAIFGPRPPKTPA